MHSRSGSALSDSYRVPKAALPLTLATFQAADFSVADLINSLTGSSAKASVAVSTSALSSAPGLHNNPSAGTAELFDPHVYIKSLEAAVDTLIPLRKQVTDQEGDLLGVVRNAEGSYNSKLKELKDNFEVRTSV